MNVAATSNQEFHASCEFVCSAIRYKEQFFLFCSKYTDLRISLFNKLHLKIPVVKLNTNECFKLIYDLMNPRSAVCTELICNFIQEALELRQ